MTASQFILDPLHGATSLWRVAWLYSFVGGAVLQIIVFLLVKAGGSVQAISLACLGYGAYVTFAAYRCDGNCPWPTLARLVRFCALISLLVVLFAAYLILTGAITLPPERATHSLDTDKAS
jgi:RsiW-degrading membrane proteinase PrsW (M82 family)